MECQSVRVHLAPERALTPEFRQTTFQLGDLWGSSQVFGQVVVLDQELESLNSEVVIALHLVSPRTDYVVALGVEAILELAGNLSKNASKSL